MKIAFLMLAIITCVYCVGSQVISARAGLVRKVDGDVFIHCHEDTAKKSKLQIGDILHNEDLVVSSESASVVLALNPGSHLFLYGATTLRVKDTALESMHFDIIVGEVIAKISELENGASLLLHPPPARVEILKKGLFRVFVQGGGETQVNVVTGEVMYNDQSSRPTRLKKGRQVDFVRRSPQ